ncbi:hypothetical protein [Antrihabitans cavernicola]|uniref:hypothetical protein n=1 Tax=Antrihabitans cavernicola TaxID=2495913 RepID=UPI0011ECA82F|nr:hypothetical protein [Spelaeibacter cavernicola]
MTSTDTQLELLPSSLDRPGPNFQNTRTVVEGRLLRLRTGYAKAGPARISGRGRRCGRATAATRRMAHLGPRVLTALAAMADANGDIDWALSIDSTVA